MRLSSLRTVSAWNIILWLVADGAQMWRTIFEERMLRADAPYVAYQQRVRWRMIPFVFLRLAADWNPTGSTGEPRVCVSVSAWPAPS